MLLSSIHTPQRYNLIIKFMQIKCKKYRTDKKTAGKPSYLRLKSRKRKNQRANIHAVESSSNGQPSK